MKWIYKQNPWWYEEVWKDKDKYLKDWNSQKIKWFPEWVNTLSLNPFSLNFVYGPRQMGKTTGMKILIKDLTEKTNPFSVFFFDFEIVASLREFRKIIESYLEIRKRESVDSSFLFLDEVTSVKEWWKVIKFFIDSGEFENDVVVVSGSSTLNVVKAPERFPGRKGKGKEICVLPLSFPEFIKIHGYKAKKIVYEEEILKTLWKRYKQTGGFPKSINGHEVRECDILLRRVCAACKQAM